MNDVSGVLGRAADLLSEPGAWTKGHVARDAKGQRVDAMSPDAVCWCIVGALERVSGDQEGRAFNMLLRVVGDFPDPATLGEHWNDARGRTQAEVVAALREAALLAQSPNTAGGGE